MSAKDSELIELLGLRVPDVAALTNRTRQAIYDGIKKSEDYFATSHLVTLLQDAKRRDVPELKNLIAFIEHSYGQQEATVDKELVLQTRVGIAQLSQAWLKARAIIFLLNNNLRHLIPDSALLLALSAAVRNYPSTTSVVVADIRLFERLEELVIDIPRARRRVHSQSIADIPAAIVDCHTHRRAFGFLATSVEEFDPEDSETIWGLANASYTAINPNMRRS